MAVREGWVSPSNAHRRYLLSELPALKELETRCLCEKLHPDTTAGGNGGAKVCVDDGLMLETRHASVARLLVECELCIYALNGRNALVLKRCDANELNSRSPRTDAKMQADILSYENEASFYALILPQLDSRLALTPRCWYAAQVGPDSADAQAIYPAFVLYLEDLGDTWHQVQMLGETTALCALKSLAQFHASMHKSQLTSTWPRRGSFWSPVLEKRPQDEWKGVDTSWREMVENFPELYEFYWLGEALVRVAMHVDAEQQAQLDGPFSTFIHGDAKTWNMFLNPSESACTWIDFQWSGQGSCSQDVEYVLATGLDYSLMFRWDEFRTAYLSFYSEALLERKIVLSESARTSFMRASDVSLIAYVVVLVSLIWRGLNSERITKNADSGPGMSMVNRSRPHVFGVCAQVCKALQRCYPEIVRECVVQKNRE